MNIEYYKDFMQLVLRASLAVVLAAGFFIATTAVLSQPLEHAATQAGWSALFPADADD